MPIVKIMNIGEIKKPSVDGQLVKAKYQAATTSPVESLKAISDQIDISIRAKERYLDYQKRNKKKKSKQLLETDIDPITEQATEVKSELNHTSAHIDFIA